MAICLLGLWIAARSIAYRQQNAVLEQLLDSIAAIDPYDVPEVVKTEPARHRWLRHFVGEKLFYSIDGIYYMGSSELAGPSLVFVAQLSRVNELGLSMTKVSDSDLAPLTQSNINLAGLDLSLTDITNDGLLLVSRIHTLQQLNLEGTLVTDVGLKPLHNLNRLESLVSPDVSDEGMRYITDIPKLRHLTVNGTVTTKGLQYLRKLPELESFTLRGPPADDDAVALFAALPNLRYVAFQGAKCSPAVIKRMRKDRPELRIHLLDSSDSTDPRKTKKASPVTAAED